MSVTNALLGIDNEIESTKTHSRISLVHFVFLMTSVIKSMKVSGTMAWVFGVTGLQELAFGMGWYEPAAWSGILSIAIAVVALILFFRSRKR